MAMIRHLDGPTARPLPDAMASRHHPIVPGVVAAVALIVLVACGGDSSSSGGQSNSAKNTPSEGPSASVSEPSAEFYEDYEGAVETIGTFWGERWGDYFEGAYSGPRLVQGGFDQPGLYDGEKGVVTCGGEPLEPDNAFYCGADDSLAFDIGLMTDMSQRIGDTFIYMVVAHEWGHAISARVDKDVQSPAGELVADCLAGAAIYEGIKDGTLTLEKGDIKEMTNGLTEAADETEWGNPEDHGTPFDRIEAFNLGRKGGPKACFNTP